MINELEHLVFDEFVDDISDLSHGVQNSLARALLCNNFDDFFPVPRFILSGAPYKTSDFF